MSINDPFTYVCLGCNQNFLKQVTHKNIKTYKKISTFLKKINKFIKNNPNSIIERNDDPIKQTLKFDSDTISWQISIEDLRKDKNNNDCFFNLILNFESDTLINFLKKDNYKEKMQIHQLFC